MEKHENLHLVYKKLGETPLEAINRFKKDNPEYATVPMTYAGRLDPMAEGLLLLLSGDEVHNKEQYNSLSKTYEVEILWGFETDTFDLLGLVKNDLQEVLKLKKVEIENELKKSVGKFEQKYPAYSSKPVQGKPLFVWAREGKIDEIEIPSHLVEVIRSEFINRRTVTGVDLLETIKEKVSLVRGDFRQKDILNRWEAKLCTRLQEAFYIDSIILEVSSGFYVRQFINDFATSLGSPAVASNIKRVRVGDFGLAKIKK